MIRHIINKFNNIKYKEQKLRLIGFGCTLLFVLFLSGFLFSISLASYQSQTRLRANIDKALYVLNREKMSFNIDSSKIIPSDDPYTYKFSVSNYTEDKESDFNIVYNLKIKTTTNLPLTLELYKNTDLNNNILSNAEIKQDVDGSYYKVYSVSDEVLMEYKDKVIDVYTLSIDFPKSYAEDLTYADCIEAIEVILDSSQAV
ncbi:MAG: hypothetical protein IJ463_00605 [Bacilli bacterium]|nr:hypothetical protein [Bacilli bacterium]